MASVSDEWKAPVTSSPDDEVSFVLGLLAFTTADPDRLNPATQAKTAEWLLKLAVLGADRDCAAYLAPAGESSVTFEVRVVDESGRGHTQAGLGAGAALRAAAEAITKSAERAEVVVRGGATDGRVVLASAAGSTVFVDPRSERTAPPVGTDEHQGLDDNGDGSYRSYGHHDDASAPTHEGTRLLAPQESVADEGATDEEPGPPQPRPGAVGRRWARADRLARSAGGGLIGSHPPSVEGMAGEVVDRPVSGGASVAQGLQDLRAGAVGFQAALSETRAEAEAQMTRLREESAAAVVALRVAVVETGEQMARLRDEMAAEVADFRGGLEEGGAQGRFRPEMSTAEVGDIRAALDESRGDMEVLLATMMDERAADVDAVQAALVEFRGYIDDQMRRMLQEFRSGGATVQDALVEFRDDAGTNAEGIIEEVRARARVAEAQAQGQAEALGAVLEDLGTGLARVDGAGLESRQRFDLIDAELSASVGYQRLAADEFSALREDVALVAEMRGELDSLRAELVVVKDQLARQLGAPAADLKPEQLDGIADAIAARLLESVGFEPGPPIENRP